MMSIASEGKERSGKGKPGGFQIINPKLGKKRHPIPKNA